MAKRRNYYVLLGAAVVLMQLGCSAEQIKSAEQVKNDEQVASTSQPSDKAKTTGDSNNTREYTLDNGLKIIVRTDKRAPIVVSQIWYKAGSSYESNGTTGVAHLLEHMMFKGTKKLAPNEFSRIIAENGGDENAFTGTDYTAYFQTLEKSRLPISFKLEADRMENLQLTAEEFSKEIKVVMEERRMRTDDKPTSLTHEQFGATAFVNSPYHHPVIGWMDDLKNMTVKDAQEWYGSYYAPNNATLVVVGDVNPDEVYELAKQTYGRVKPKKVKQIKPQREIVQKGTRRVTVKAPAKLPYFVMGFKVPVVKTAEEEWEPYALEMLANVLDGGESARFSKNLLRGSQIAANVGASYDIYSRLSDLFIVDGTPSNGKSVEQLEAAVQEQLDKLKTELVPIVELDRIKTQVIASKVYEKDSVFYQAMQMGTLETVGLDWRLMDEFVEKFKQVTPEQVQKVARKYLVADSMTVATLDPQEMSANGGMDNSHEGMGHGN